MSQALQHFHSHVGTSITKACGQQRCGQMRPVSANWTKSNTAAGSQA